MRRAAVHVVVLLLRGLSERATEVGCPTCSQRVQPSSRAPGHLRLARRMARGQSPELLYTTPVSMASPWEWMPQLGVSEAVRGQQAGELPPEASTSGSATLSPTGPLSLARSCVGTGSLGRHPATLMWAPRAPATHSCSGISCWDAVTCWQNSNYLPVLPRVLAPSLPWPVLQGLGTACYSRKKSVQPPAATFHVTVGRGSLLSLQTVQWLGPSQLLLLPALPWALPKPRRPWERRHLLSANGRGGASHFPPQQELVPELGLRSPLS